jgi:hypothetical protein
MLLQRFPSSMRLPLQTSRPLRLQYRQIAKSDGLHAQDVADAEWISQSELWEPRCVGFRSGRKPEPQLEPWRIIEQFDMSAMEAGNGSHNAEP